MAEWLYKLISDADPQRRPDFAQQSALNWMHALAYEISAEHGEGFDAQRASLSNALASVKLRAGMPHPAQVFEPLYAATTYSTSLISLACQDAVGAWQCPGAIIEWYYAVYNAARAIVAACNNPAPETHAAVASALKGQLRAILPHPLNMRAVHVAGEKFTPELPHYPGTKPKPAENPLAEKFKESRDHAQRMLLAYLNGSAGFYVSELKAKLLAGPLAKKGVANFRSKAARQLRDEKLAGKEYNFLHLAFRYRGKANYRDAVFLAYGSQHLEDGGEFVSNMAQVARFTTMCAMVYVWKRVGDHTMKAFLADLKQRFHGYNTFRSYP